MIEADGPAGQRRWHQALEYAVTGETSESPSSESAPDMVALARELLATRGGPALWAHRRETLRTGGVWPHPVPSELMTGLRYAQFAAALRRLLQALELDDPGVVGQTVTPLTPAVRRLLDEVPPHHGS